MFLLGIGDNMRYQRGFPGGFRAVDFHNAPAGQAANAEREIRSERTGRNGFNLRIGGGVAEFDNGALAILFLYLRHYGAQGGSVVWRGLFLCGHTFLLGRQVGVKIRSALLSKRSLDVNGTRFQLLSFYAVMGGYTIFGDL
jgi:hypothetical protein